MWLGLSKWLGRPQVVPGDFVYYKGGKSDRADAHVQRGLAMLANRGGGGNL